ncbi:MAG TPA: DNA-formamidopyrimidine glycosylase, partial [Planctomycetes bacterium]|nr:DNA-formamidopyrimidine glycosylase [Planctomycetota bacterium]
MPELPEVETTRRGIELLVRDCRIEGVEVRQGALRQPVPGDLSSRLRGARFGSIGRRAKYLLVGTSVETLLVHLGMSGSLRVVDGGEDLRTHDHLIFHLEDGRQLRYHDPRRFGIVIWGGEDPQQHPLLEKIGPEPLDNPEL